MQQARKIKASLHLRLSQSCRAALYSQASLVSTANYLRSADIITLMKKPSAAAELSANSHESPPLSHPTPPPSIAALPSGQCVCRSVRPFPLKSSQPWVDKIQIQFFSPPTIQPGRANLQSFLARADKYSLLHTPTEVTGVCAAVKNNLADR
jgi:hypothetical protein